MTGAILRVLALKPILDTFLAKFSGKSEFFSYAYSSPRMGGGGRVDRTRPHQQASDHQSNAVGSQAEHILPMLRKRTHTLRRAEGKEGG